VLVVPQVGLYGGAPVDFVVARAGVAHGTAQGALHRLAEWIGQLLFQVADYLGYYFAGGGFGLLRHHTAEREQGADQVHIGLHRAQDFGL
jgi:hypothetical protein